MWKNRENGKTPSTSLRTTRKSSYIHSSCRQTISYVWEAMYSAIALIRIFRSFETSHSPLNVSFVGRFEKESRTRR